jgi:hypothetical protein
MIKRKWLVVGIILLFISVAVAPSINFTVVKAFQENDLVEVTTQACGILGYGNTTVRLTKEQYQNLEQYLVGFRARLNQTTTREEAVPLFKEAVVELQKYHLLPGGMSVMQAQSLVVGSYLDSPVLRKLPEMVTKKTSNTLTNTLCLVAGLTDDTQIFSLLLWSWIFVANHQDIFYLLFQHPYFFLVMCFSLFGILMFDYIRPVMAWSTIYILGGNGSLFTLGLDGMKQHRGYLLGEIIGFSGIKILLDWKIPLKYFYIGSAWAVKMSCS